MRVCRLGETIPRLGPPLCICSYLEAPNVDTFVHVRQIDLALEVGVELVSKLQIANSYGRIDLVFPTINPSRCP